MWPINKKIRNKILSLHAGWLFENGYYDESIDCLNQATDYQDKRQIYAKVPLSEEGHQSSSGNKR